MSPAHRPYDAQSKPLKLGKGDKIPQGHALGGSALWIVIPLLMFALVAALLWLGSLGQATRIDDTHLVGTRSPSPINILVLRDDSGSFDRYQAIRDDSIRQVLAWAPGNLRDDDTMTIVSFASGAVVTMPPTTVADIVAHGVTPIQSTASGGTNIVPALREARDLLNGSQNPSSIIAITDTLVSDARPADIDELLADLKVASVSVIMPTGMPVGHGWASVFGGEAEFHADSGDAEGTALAVGRALAHATGQRLETNLGFDVTTNSVPAWTLPVWVAPSWVPLSGPWQVAFIVVFVLVVVFICWLLTRIVRALLNLRHRVT